MTAFFKLKEVPHEDRLPQILKKAREEVRLSLEEAEKKTKIQIKYLEALEQGQYDKLPADVYAKGFLRNYCQILGLNYQKILTIYKRERGIQKSVKKIEEPQMPKPIKAPRLIITPKTFVISGLALAFLIGATYIWYQFSSFAGAPTLSVDYPEDNLQIKTSSIIVSGKTDSVSDLFINEQLININPDGTFKTLISLQEGVNIIKFSAKNKLGKETIIERRVLAEFEIAKGEETKEKTEAKAKTTEKLKLTLEIGPNSAWLHIEADGKVVYEGVMLAGTSQSFEALEKIVLTTGNAGSTSIIFNDQNFGKLGNSGEVKRGLTFDKNTTKIE